MTGSPSPIGTSSQPEPQTPPPSYPTILEPEPDLVSKAYHSAYSTFPWRHPHGPTSLRPTHPPPTCRHATLPYPKDTPCADPTLPNRAVNTPKRHAAAWWHPAYHRVCKCQCCCVCDPTRRLCCPILARDTHSIGFARLPYIGLHSSGVGGTVQDRMVCHAEEMMRWDRDFGA